MTMTTTFRLNLFALSSLALANIASPALAKAPIVIDGVYEAIPDGRVLGNGLRNTGNLSTVVGLSAAKDADPRTLIDPARLCQPIGPFRMMAEPGAKIEIVPTEGAVVILFQDLSHGFWRTVYLDRGHKEDFEPSFEGDSVGQWGKGGLVIDTVGFNDYTWLNAAGARHSGGLHLTERLRPIMDGKYLEYRVTAEDVRALPGGFSYTRYYRKVESEITEDTCTIEDAAPIPGH
jgi:hypothetical protein